MRDLDPERVLEHTLAVAETVDLSLETAIVFGSVARGEATAQSDVDLILVSPDFEGLPFVERAVDFEWEWDREYGSPDITPVTPAEFDERKEAAHDIVPIALEGGKRIDIQ